MRKWLLLSLSLATIFAVSLAACSAGSAGGNQGGVTTGGGGSFNNGGANGSGSGNGGGGGNGGSGGAQSMSQGSGGSSSGSGQGSSTSGSGGPSGLGQECGSTADCGSGLECVPFPGSAGGGVCDLSSYGLTPTGKSCSGECESAADCCEMPVGVTLATPNGTKVEIHHCEDIVSLVLQGNTSICSNEPSADSATGIGCFYYQTYCQCAASTWTCNANLCSYTGACSLSAANQFGGCPSQTRTGAPLVTSCDTTANTCSLETSGCSSNSDCSNGTAVADTAGATCRDGDCACFDGGCYLTCASNLDCQTGFVCDTGGTKLCKLAPGCTTNDDCAADLHDVRAQCTNGACGIPCMDDHDCSPSGAIPGLGPFNGTVCGSMGICEAVGCSSDQDCAGAPAPDGGAPVQTFCVTPASGSASSTVHSSITS
jgi:hypothetical protein